MNTQEALDGLGNKWHEFSEREREERRGAFSLTRDGATMDTFQSATTLKPPA